MGANGKGILVVVENAKEDGVGCPYSPSVEAFHKALCKILKAPSQKAKKVAHKPKG